MSISDKIQLTLAIIAGVSAILAFFSILSSNRQIKLQKKQWEFSYKPIFKFIYLQDFGDRCVFILENPNNVFYKILGVSHTDENAVIHTGNYGRISVTSSKTGKETNYEGIEVTLKGKEGAIPSGRIKINGIDAIGNEFTVISGEIIFNGTKLANSYDIRNSYLTNM
ncbi:hypothetical protein [Virgibacillus kimchii]